MNSKRLLSSTLVMLSLLSLLPALTQAEESFSADQTFGDAMPAGDSALSLKEAIASLDGQSQATVKVIGKVTEVCQAKGCWMILVDGDTYARITFKDYGFFVPIETSMQRTVVYGVLSEHVLSGEQAEHFAQDAGAQSTLAMDGEVREYSLVASAVALEDRS
ncbi:MAG: DUF4920 domain-containing protein [Pseudohongiellaceae bacterium]